MSKKRGKEISLSEKLSSLIQTKPSTVESDEDDFMTVDKIGINDKDDDYSADEFDSPKLRKINTGLLLEDDTKYLGKSISRKDIDSDEQSDDSDSEENLPNDTKDLISEKSDSENEANIDGETNELDDIESSDNESDNKKIKSNKKDGQDNFNNEIFVKAAGDIEKGKAIKNQLHIWDFLLECRMKFQKCLVASNQFPNHENFSKFESKGSQFVESVVKCKKSVKHLLRSLLSLQNVLLNLNEEFLGSVSNYKTNDESEEEGILRDSANNESDEKTCSFSSAKLKNLNDFSSEIRKRHENFQTYRNGVVQKWNDKTRIGFISNKNFSAFEQSILKQIEHVLLDKDRLIKRTQIKRSNWEILGEKDQEPPQKKLARSENVFNNSLDNKSKVLHKEIFDDSDFYHQLLSELVKRKANDVTDPIQLGRQWMQLQKIRSKMKKTVDTKASKGRKVRFVVHPKLVNFMMPINDSTYNDESKSELFNSLFGKAKK